MEKAISFGKEPTAGCTTTLRNTLNKQRMEAISLPVINGTVVLHGWMGI
jgi:hypothetical protein